MNSVERLTTAFNRQVPDRVPVSCWLGLKLLRRMFPRDLTMLELFDLWIDDPLNSIVKAQEDLGFDPLFWTMSQHHGEIHEYTDRLFRWPEEALERWRERKVELEQGPGYRVVQHQVNTPAGKGSWTYRIEGYSDWPLEHLLKEEVDLDLLEYWPDPALIDVSIMQGLVDKVADRAFFNHHTPGPWDEAAELRGITTLSMDIYDRPGWVHQLMRVITDRQIRHMRRLAEIRGLHSVSLNETWVGVGLSPQAYREFILPYDREVVQTIKDAGLLVSFHNCGRGSRFLEDMVSTGADALETLTSTENSGDFDLADVKRRVGERICLFGGFNERLLTSENPEDVRAEVKRCIDAAAEGGGYVLRSMGQIFDTWPGNIEVMTAAVREYGRYQ